ASSSESIDLHSKKADYERAGVDEYVVILLRQADVRWFLLEGGIYRSLSPDADHLFRSPGFPGLWLDPQALIRGDIRRLRAALRQRLKSEGYREWRLRLAARRRS